VKAITPRTTLPVIAAVLCFAGAIGVQMARDRVFPRDAGATTAFLYVRSPEAIKRLSLGFDALAADLYWIRAIQHYGGERLSKAAGARSYHLLYPLLDLTTTLDPYFNIAYRFGAIFLSEEYPGGPGRPDQAVALLRRGVAVQPQKWQYPHDIGFVYYWSLDDPTSAATWFQRAAELPDAPAWLEPLAASMLTQGADRTSARYLWRQILNSDEEWLRRSAERALAQLDALDAIDLLTARVKAAPRAAGQPYSWEAVVRAGYLRGIPADPAGVPFDLDPQTGEVRVSPASPLMPMPRMARSR
jgi:hypothetical protein